LTSAVLGCPWAIPPAPAIDGSPNDIVNELSAATSPYPAIDERRDVSTAEVVALLGTISNFVLRSTPGDPLLASTHRVLDTLDCK